MVRIRGLDHPTWFCLEHPHPGPRGFAALSDPRGHLTEASLFDHFRRFEDRSTSPGSTASGVDWLGRLHSCAGALGSVPPTTPNAVWRGGAGGGIFDGANEESDEARTPDVPMASIKATFYLPIKDNDGRDLSLEIAEVEDRCFEFFGAWTTVGHFKGVWRMDTGERRMDTSAVYVVVLENSRLPQLEEILRIFKSKAGQEAIYLEVQHHIDLRLI